MGDKVSDPTLPKKGCTMRKETRLDGGKKEAEARRTYKRGTSNRKQDREKRKKEKSSYVQDTRDSSFKGS